MLSALSVGVIVGEGEAPRTLSQASMAATTTFRDIGNCPGVGSAKLSSLLSFQAFSKLVSTIAHWSYNKSWTRSTSGFYKTAAYFAVLFLPIAIHHYPITSPSI